MTSEQDASSLVDFQADERARQEAWYREKQAHDEASQLDEAFEEGFAIGFAKGFEEGFESVSFLRINFSSFFRSFSA